MSINQINSSQITHLNKTLSRDPSGIKTPSLSFSDLIQSATQKLDNRQSNNAASLATAAAEILKLEMMKSALSVGGDSSAPPVRPIGLPLQYSFAGTTNQGQEFDTVTQTAPAEKEQSMESIGSYSSTPTIQGIVDKAAQKYGVDRALIKAVIKAESNFNPSAVSSAGAQGLMQLMPATAKGLGVKDSFNPEQNVMAGTRFLKDLIERYNGNLDSALAAYNWGPGNVDRKGTTSLPHETRAYLSKVKSYYQQFIA